MGRSHNKSLLPNKDMSLSGTRPIMKDHFLMIQRLDLHYWLQELDAGVHPNKEIRRNEAGKYYPTTQCRSHKAVDPNVSARMCSLGQVQAYHITSHVTTPNQSVSLLFNCIKCLAVVLGPLYHGYEGVPGKTPGTRYKGVKLVYPGCRICWKACKMA